MTFRVRKCDLVRSDVSYLYERNAPKKTTQTPYSHLLRLTSVDYIFLCIGNPSWGETNTKGDGKFKFIHQSACRTSAISQLNINNGQSLVGQFTSEIPLLNFIPKPYELIISFRSGCIYTFDKGVELSIMSVFTFDESYMQHNPIKNSKARL